MMNGRKKRFQWRVLLVSFLILLLVATLSVDASSSENDNKNRRNSDHDDDDDATTPSAPLLRDVSSSFRELLGRLDMISHLEQAKSILTYDRMVFMPMAASNDRGAQVNALATIIHEKSTDPVLRKLILRAMSDAKHHHHPNNDPDAVRLLQLEMKAFEEKVRVPVDVAQRVAQLSTQAYASWIHARQKNDFAIFAPTLASCFEVSKERAVARRGDDESHSVYTQLLDEFEVGMSQERIDAMFADIQTALVPLIQRVLSSSYQPSTALRKGTYDVDKQKEVYSEIVAAIGFNITAGRIDTSIHPFTTSFGPNDVRITSRFHKSFWYQGLAAMLHEGGHAIYEQNRGQSSNRDITGPQYSIDHALSMGTHESQALFWERHIGHSKSFWKWAIPKLGDSFPDTPLGRLSSSSSSSSSSPEQQVYEAINAVTPTHIRVEADELTYPLHIIMRYEIEKDVVEGNLSVEDIPKRWKETMKKKLLHHHVNAPDDDKHCALQDVHWATLAFGYFPTYLIGSVAAAQLAYYCRLDMPNMDTLVENGTFEPIRRWLTDKVHRHGSRYLSLDDMFQNQLGEKLNPQYYINYLTDKYTKLYHLADDNNNNVVSVMK